MTLCRCFLFSLLIPLSAFAKLTLAWEKNILTVHAPHLPGGKIETWYLEAYCKPGSTDREWNKSLIAHKTSLVSATPTELKLRCELADGVTIDHLIKAGNDTVSFTLTAHNPTSKASEAHWAQPCVRVGEFTGTQQDEDKYTYLPKSFVFLNGKQTYLPSKNWATKARYIPGQVWCPCHVDRNDVNPRPLSSDIPSNGLIGCVSGDNKWLFATAWDPYQELFQGVIRCLHSDFRIGGLPPGETKTIRGKFYFLKNDTAKLLQRYQKDFPVQSRDHKTLNLPSVEPGPPSAGKRVSLTPPEYKDTKVHHTLYLPPHWKKDQASHPLIVEFSGNHAPSLGSTGKVEDSALGYGLSGGNAVVLNLPFISPDGKRNQPTWWGDKQASVNYAKLVVPRIIKQFNIDPKKVVLCGFSRGAIGVSHIGLHDDEIAALWSGFMTHDHFDGVRSWVKPWGAPLQKYRRETAKRIARLKGRPLLVCQNGHTKDIKAFLTFIPGVTNVTYLDVNTREILGSFPNPIAPHPHTDRWLLKPGAARHQTWRWLHHQILNRQN